MLFIKWMAEDVERVINAGGNAIEMAPRTAKMEHRQIPVNMIALAAEVSFVTICQTFE
jgi:hypothetical protein